MIARCLLAALFLTTACNFAGRAAEPQFAGRTRQEWVKELDSGRRQRSHAAWAISQFAVQEAGPRDAALWLNELYLLIESDSSTVRYWGLIGLGQFLVKLEPGDPARGTALDVLTDSLMDRSPAARLAAAEALASAGQPKAALPVLVDAMHSSQEAVRIQAAAALAHLGEAARPALATLQSGAEDPSEYVKRLCARALARLNSQ